MVFTTEQLKEYAIGSILTLGAKFVDEQNDKLTAGITNPTVRSVVKILEGFALQGVADYIKTPYIDTLLKISGLLIGAKGIQELIKTFTGPKPAPAPAPATAAATRVIIAPRPSARATVL